MKKFSVFALLLISTSLVAACQNATTQVNQTPAVKKETVANQPASNQITPENSKEAIKQISFKSADNLLIAGTFYAADKPNSPAVVMLHQWGSSRASYNDLAKQFQSNGVAVLTIDGRGFGESAVRADGSKMSPNRDDNAVKAMKTDVAEAVKFLAGQPNVDKNRIGIVGASYGSSLAIIHAAGDAAVKAVALLSPGLNYFGNLPTEPAVKSFGARPILLVAAEDDAESADAVRRLDALATGDKHEIKIYQKGGHGTGILSAGVGLDKLLIDFFSANL